MNKYHDATTTDLSTRMADLSVGQSSSMMSLDAIYGFEGDELEIGGTMPVRTVELELQSYVTAPCSPSDTNILSFWEVSREPTLSLIAN
jgi:hypothetical protein